MSKIEKIFKLLSFLVLSIILSISCSNSSNKSSDSDPSGSNGGKGKAGHCATWQDFIKSNGDFKEEVLGFILMHRTDESEQDEKFKRLREDAETVTLKDQAAASIGNSSNPYLFPNRDFHRIKTQYTDSQIETLKQACLRLLDPIKGYDCNDDFLKRGAKEKIEGYNLREEDSQCVMDTFDCHLTVNCKKDQPVEVDFDGIRTSQSTMQKFKVSQVIKPECKSIITVDNSLSSEYSIINFTCKTACDCVFEADGLLDYRDECGDTSMYKIRKMSEYLKFSSVDEFLNYEIENHLGIELKEMYEDDFNLVPSFVPYESPSSASCRN